MAQGAVFSPILANPTSQVIMSSPLLDGNSPSNGVSNIFGAFGALLGYVGSEAVNQICFETLLWPQRALSNFSLRQLPVLALLMPMGGPMHKVGLRVFDKIHEHGLLKGPEQGHMLGTAFFPELAQTYTMHGKEFFEQHTEPLRNCLWARVLANLSTQAVRPTKKRRSSTLQNLESAIPKSKTGPTSVRARVRVNHLTFSKATQSDKESDIPFVSEQYKTPNLRVLLGIVGSELSGLIIATFVAVAFRSLWALIWIIPVILRLFSAIFALERDPLMPLNSSTAFDPPCDFEAHYTQSDGNFLLMSGPPTLILQFARHYGHPKRNRFREVVQLLTIVLFACLFPLELVFLTIWMPVSLQQVWLCYQLYVVLAMHTVRYSRVACGSDTPTSLARALATDGCLSSSDDKSEHAVLFGHTRNGPETLRVDVHVTHHDRYKTGKEAMDELLQRRHKNTSETTLVESEPKS